MKRAASFACGALVVLASACGSSTSEPLAAASRPDPLALTPVVDENPDPRIVEFRLEAREADKQFGSTPVSRVWTYNGTAPGPLVDAGVGDRLIVHFKNSLPEPTTVHWHGIRLPAAMDGTLAMQSPIPPGGEFRYEFVLKDAGLFWFHPHVRTDVQVEKGLAGVIRVRGADEPVVDDERIVVLDDVRLKDDGSFPTYLDDTSKMMGREGNTLLVNGVVNATIPVRAGATTRWRILNVANGRFFNLTIPGVTFRVIGTDGGFYGEPHDMDHLLVAPAERYDVVFQAPAEVGRELELRNDPYERGHESGLRAPMMVAKVRVDEDRIENPAPLPRPIQHITRLPDGPVDTPIVLNEATSPTGEILFTVNDAVYPNVPPVMVANGTIRVLEVKNASEMDHPFHLHGFFFQILARDGVPTSAADLVDKDTVVVPMMSTLKLVARFDEPGMWMYHCHINEHSEGGMMGEIHVE